MSLDAVIFLISAVVAIFGAFMMIAQRNPVASVLYLILSLVAQAVIYVQLGALFVGVMLVIVYAGAILVLFLFVIMLLNLRGGEDLGTPSGAVSRFTKYIVSLLLFVEFVFIIRGVYLQTPPAQAANLPIDGFGSVQAVSMLLFTKYLYPFQLTGVLLLIAVVGAVVIARKDRTDEMPEESADAAVEEKGPDEAVKP
jgi:NADH-quinone oxidoreductase subunit J